MEILSHVNPLIPVGRGTGGSPESACVECGLQDCARWRGQFCSSSTEERAGLRNFSHALLCPQVTELEVLVAAITPEPSVAARDGSVSLISGTFSLLPVILCIPIHTLPLTLSDIIRPPHVP